MGSSPRKVSPFLINDSLTAQEQKVEEPEEHNVAPFGTVADDAQESTNHGSSPTGPTPVAPEHETAKDESLLPEPSTQQDVPKKVPTPTAIQVPSSPVSD